MNQQLVFTIIAQDKLGIVTRIAEIVNEHNGNWLDSRMSQLAGEFAGIVHIEIPLENRKGLEEAFTALETSGISITLRQANAITQSESKFIEIEVFGNDRTGIVAEITKLFSKKDINIVEFDTNITDAPHSGGCLFHSNAVIGVDKQIDLDDLQDKLRDLADELSLDIEWTSRI